MKRLAVATLLTLTCLAAAACTRPSDTTPPRASDSSAANAPADRQQLENRIRELAAKVLGVAPEEVDVGTPLSKQKVAADELDMVEIVMEVEDAFGVEIPDADISGTDEKYLPDLSVRKLAEIVAAKTARK
jgi:acyl carrier protein